MTNWTIKKGAFVSDSMQLVLDRLEDVVEFDDLEWEISNAANAALIYTEDQWTLLKEYFSPSDSTISLDQAFYFLLIDLLDVIVPNE